MRRFLVALLAVPVLAYAGICVLMYGSQRGLVYLPQHTRVEAAQTDFELRRGGVVLRGWTVNPGGRDVLLYFGGNADPLHGMRDRLAAWFPRRTSYLLAYRGYGASDGEPRQELLFADALALFDDVRRRHPDARIAVIGRSLGSGVASYVAGHRPVDRLVLVTPFDSLAAVAGAHYPWLPTGLLVTERFDSAHWLRDFRGPVLVIRAGRDQVIPPANTDRLVAALSPAPRVLVLPESDHDAVLSSPAERDALVAFLGD